MKPAIPPNPFQPTPNQSVLYRIGVSTVLVRRWESSAAMNCRLCPLCVAKHGLDGQAICVVQAPENLTSEELPGFGSGARLRVVTGDGGG